ncbi:uncharacterized protein B0I36DRAFT_65405 [Microdochium trichocladiopsis]|uniref:Uncharacterized protein n=1 Tax=Microdochium trichocladiopsis TaxID=1682393 RepID=A0A9P9BXU4_9PEZI|nr:uncharacterized protein B0I36DRAFT_65405 [Microdochium trichocladiopsis]KAH7037393.1 hypothetical protein B0I36DRAFT_65405 [Microdochium trichocladiopsis]
MAAWTELNITTYKYRGARFHLMNRNDFLCPIQQHQHEAFHTPPAFRTVTLQVLPSLFKSAHQDGCSVLCVSNGEASGNQPPKAPGKRCPTCTDLVWVLPGRCCPHCGTYVG